MRTRRRPTALALAMTAALTGSTMLATAATANERVVVVRPGDTLSELAVKFGVSLERLAGRNGLRNPDHIVVGQRLRIDGPVAQAPAPEPAPADRHPVSHRVAAGEHLTGIAGRYGTTVRAIAAANGLANPSFIRVGQLLEIPGAATALAPARAAVSHRVAAGEHLTGIAARYSTTVRAIVAVNGLANPSYIRVGQLLEIPGAAPAKAGPAMPASMAALMARRDETRRLIVAEARRQGLDPALALAISWHESGWQQGVVSSAGAVGIMQLLPATGEWVAASILGEPVRIHQAGSNVRAGVALLRHYLARYGGDRALALAAYYQGQSATDRHGVYPVSRPYIASILALEKLFSR